MNRRTSTLLVGALAVFAVIGATAGAQAQGTTGASTANGLTIGISTVGTEHGWDINCYNGLINKSKELGFNVIALDGQRRPEKQLSDVKSLIARKVSVIAIELGDFPSLAPAAKEARDAGIPVVTADFDNPSTLSNVSSNNKTAMAAVTEQLVKDLGEKGDIGIFYTPGIPVADERYNVFKSVIEKYPNVHIVAQEPWLIPGTVPDAYQKAKDMIAAHPSIRAFWTVFDQPMIGAAQAIADLGLQKTIKTYGFDGDDVAMKMLMDPNSAYGATYAQQPYLIGETTAEQALKVVKGEHVDAHVYVPGYLVTPANAKQVWDTLPQYKEAE